MEGKNSKDNAEEAQSSKLKAQSEKEPVDYYEKYLRLQAEFENARKRMEKEKSEYAKFANEYFVMELLPILDSLEMAEKYIKEANDLNAVRQGVDMIQSQIQKFLKDIGLERIDAVGVKFDPNFHEAVETEEAKEKEDGIVTAELKPGYRFNGKLLRPVAVKIAKRNV